MEFVSPTRYGDLVEKMVLVDSWAPVRKKEHKMPLQVKNQRANKRGTKQGAQDKTAFRYGVRRQGRFLGKTLRERSERVSSEEKSEGYCFLLRAVFSSSHAIVSLVTA